MKIRISIFTLLLLCVAANRTCLAASGGESGGGGNAVVCKDELGKIESVELLDLFEGRTTEGLEYTDKLEMKIALQKSVDKLDQALSPKELSQTYIAYPYWIFKGGTGLLPVMEYANHFDSLFRVLPDDTGLPPLDDSHEIVVPKKCKIERLALYQGSKILLDGSLWKKMNNINKAALILHEALYKYDRQLKGAKDSRNARKIVAKFMSNQKLENVLDGVPKTGASQCHAFYQHDDAEWGSAPLPSENIEFFVYWKNDKIVVNFTDFFGTAIFSKTSVEINKPILNHENQEGKNIASWVEGLPTITMHYGQFTDHGIREDAVAHFVLAVGKTENSEYKWINFAQNNSIGKHHWMTICNTPFIYKN